MFQVYKWSTMDMHMFKNLGSKFLNWWKVNLDNTEIKLKPLNELFMTNGSMILKRNISFIKPVKNIILCKKKLVKYSSLTKYIANEGLAKHLSFFFKYYKLKAGVVTADG